MTLTPPDPEVAFQALLMQLDNARSQEFRLVGIHSGGVWVAKRLARSLGITSPVGELDIAYYRDDFHRIGLHATNHPTLLPFEIDGAQILLVDDVLFTGRTTRGALNVLFDFGRPSSVELATLFDRGGRELPVAPNYCGAKIDVDEGQTLVLQETEGVFVARFESTSGFRDA